MAGALVLVLLAAACDAVTGDFTADGKTDQVYWSTQTNAFYTAGSSTPLFTGQAGDIPVPGDYNGDLKWEPAVLRGTTWISSALAGPISFDPVGMPAGPPAAIQFGPGLSFTPPTLLAVPGDYDGTGKTEPAYFDQVDDSWWIMGHATSIQLGTPPSPHGGFGFSIPAPADYDGDGKTDPGVFDLAGATFRYLSSKTGQVVTVALTSPAGDPLVTPVPADYDQVGHAEPAATDLNASHWVVAGHAGTFATFTPDNGDYLPAPGAYTTAGQVIPGLMDMGVGTWWLAGQPAPAPTTETSWPDVPAVLPVAYAGNIVRLTIYVRCVGDPTFWECPGVVGS